MQIEKITQFHESPAAIAWWVARLGVALRWLTPKRRHLLLAIGAIWVLFKLIGKTVTTSGLPVSGGAGGIALTVVCVLAVCWLVYLAAVRYSSLPGVVRRHPQLTLHGFYWGMLFLLWNTEVDAGLWRQVFVVVALIFPFLIWRLGYLLFSGQYGRMAGTTFTDHFFTLLPYYGGSNTPYGKGLAYLSRCEAKTEEDLARSQLAGIKLLLLAWFLDLLLDILFGFIYGPGNKMTARMGGWTLGIPKLDVLVARGGVDTALWTSWASIYLELIHQVLRHAVTGHEIIGVLRLFGFNVFRNTYKPLLAESIVEFWNRYYYYFKELLANFFFLPTFTGLGRSLRNWPKVRLFVAVFAAACVGNTYYHVIRLTAEMVQGNVWGVLVDMQSRIFYCLLLAIGIFISMLREQGRAGQLVAAGGLRRFLRIAGVWTFFSLIFIWHASGGASFATRVNFFLSLFGIA